MKPPPVLPWILLVRFKSGLVAPRSISPVLSMTSPGTKPTTMPTPTLEAESGNRETDRVTLPIRILLGMFFLSGVSGLILETVFTRLLSYVFGNTVYAASTVISTFLGGLALGAVLIGRSVDRRMPVLWIYGALELLVGTYSLFVPRLFSLLTKAYVTLYHWLQPGPAGLTALRFGLSAVMVVVPAALMGGTLPVLARYLSAQAHDFEARLDYFYAWNTLGAASGALLSTFFLIPKLGIDRTLAFACAMSFVVFVGAALLARAEPEKRSDYPVSDRLGGPVSNDVALRRFAPLLLLASFLTGAVALSYEVIWTHVLAFTVGSTVYAFGVMLFTILCGLGGGARIVSRHISVPALWARALGFSQMALGGAVLLTLPLWGWVPDLFSGGIRGAAWLDIVGIGFLIVLRMAYLGWILRVSLARQAVRWRQIVELIVEGGALWALLTRDLSFVWKHEAASFIVSELLRFLCAFYLLIIPSLLLGMSFPLLLNLSTRFRPQVGRGVGGVYAANTFGAVLGSALTGFALLPRFGSLTTFRIAGTANLAFGVLIALCFVHARLWHRLVIGGTAIALSMFLWTGQGSWDLRRMSRGCYVYFNSGWPVDRVLYLHEDMQGGVTSVIQVGTSRVLLSNGKFQGNNTGEIPAQIRFALIPILFTRHFQNALVIGLGTGNTLRTLSDFPFRHIDAVEIAPAVADAARKWFEDVNAGVLERNPRVHLTIGDGRNFLLLSREQYDLITVEITSIWISGEADLYNKEFYELCRAHMGTEGILQQWVQIHHMRPQDFLVILNTALRVFPHVAFFLGPEQGLLIASPALLKCSYRQAAIFDADPNVRQELAVLGMPSITSLLGEMALGDEAFRRVVSLLPNLTGRSGDFASTDLRPYLEYETPKGNVVPYDTIPVNSGLIRSAGARQAPAGRPASGLRSQMESKLAAGRFEMATQVAEPQHRSVHASHR